MKSSSSAVNRGRGVRVKRFSNVLTAFSSTRRGARICQGQEVTGEMCAVLHVIISWKIGCTWFNYVGSDPDGSGWKLLESV